MSDDNDRSSAGSNTEPATATVDTPEVAELEADIARTREELAQTVDQLAAKLDVKTRIRNRVSETRDAATVQVRSVRDRLTGVDGKPTPAALSIGGGVVAAIAAVVLVKLWIRPSRRQRQAAGADVRQAHRRGQHRRRLPARRRHIPRRPGRP